MTTYDVANGDVVDAFTLKRAAEEAPADDSQQGSTEGSSTGQIVGIVVGVIALLAAAAGAAAYFNLIPGLELPKF